MLTLAIIYSLERLSDSIKQSIVYLKDGGGLTTLFFIISSMPSKGFASENVVVKNDNNSQVSESADSQEPKVGEIVDERTANTKTYYDGNGNQTDVNDLKLIRTVKRLPDENNRVSKLTQTQQGLPDAVQTWDYPSNSDKLKSTTFTLGSTSETTSYTYNGLDQNTTVTNSGKNFTFNYDELGNLRSSISSNNTNTTFQYTNRNLIDSERIQLDNGTILLDESYVYDSNGNRKQINLPNNQSIVYNYDYLNQLTSEEYSDGTKKEYSYDGFGNRTDVKVTKDGTTTDTNAQFNQENQLTKFGNDNIAYDADGNRISDGDFIYKWNPAGQLISVTKNGESDPFVSYTYDEQGRRIEKDLDGTSTRYFYDGDSINVLYETNSAGTVLRSYIYSADGQRLAMQEQGQTFYYHYNAHGDVVALTDDNKQVVATYKYGAWGNVTQSTVQGLAADNSFGYAGYMFDKEIKMYYLIARYYQPDQGVFISLDPQPGTPDDLLSQNGYNYTANNPISFVDSNGNYIIDSAWLIVDGLAYISNPSLAGAGWIALDLASFADPTGSASTIAHSGKLLRGAEIVEEGIKAHKHHIYQQTFRKWFKKKGISIDKFTVKIPSNVHLKGVHGKGLGDLPGKWNDKWKEFIKEHPNASKGKLKNLEKSY